MHISRHYVIDFWSWNLFERVLEKSWNFFLLFEYEPCYTPVMTGVYTMGLHSIMEPTRDKTRVYLPAEEVARRQLTEI
jgi:hypothetical protein